MYPLQPVSYNTMKGNTVTHSYTHNHPFLNDLKKYIKWIRTLGLFSIIAVPEPPENLKWRDKSAKTIFLHWESPSYDGGAPIKGYIVDKCQRGTDKWEACCDPIPELK